MMRVVGIGSPFGDDRAGLEAARRLAAEPPPDTTVCLADRPGIDVLELFEATDAVILIDAARSGAPLGTLHDLALDAVARSTVRLVSSHGFGVGEALVLARVLDRLPRRGRVLAIEAAASTPGAALSPAVETAIAAAVLRARVWTDRFRSARRSSEEAS